MSRTMIFTLLTTLFTTVLCLAKHSSTTKFPLVLVVDLDGGGNFSTVQGAVDAVPNSNSFKTLIIIKFGVYREKVTINETKINIVIQGKRIHKTSIEWNDTANSTRSTKSSYSFGVIAANFVAYNINFQLEYCTITKPQNMVGAQAVAARIEGDQAAFYGCGFYSAQKLLYPSDRVAYEKQLTDAEASYFTGISYIDGD